MSFGFLSFYSDISMPQKLSLIVISGGIPPAFGIRPISSLFVFSALSLTTTLKSWWPFLERPFYVRRVVSFLLITLFHYSKNCTSARLRIRGTGLHSPAACMHLRPLTNGEGHLQNERPNDYLHASNERLASEPCSAPPTICMNLSSRFCGGPTPQILEIGMLVHELFSYKPAYHRDRR